MNYYWYYEATNLTFFSLAILFPEQQELISFMEEFNRCCWFVSSINQYNYYDSYLC